MFVCDIQPIYVYECVCLCMCVYDCVAVCVSVVCACV